MDSCSLDMTSTFRSFRVANQVTTDPIAPPGSRNISKSFSISKSISKGYQLLFTVAYWPSAPSVFFLSPVGFDGSAATLKTGVSLLSRTTNSSPNAMLVSAFMSILKK